jgi:hypothetical protein
MPDATYKCGSRNYLARARMLLDQNSQQALFYAAFELRCGIEARLQEHLEVQEHLSKKRKEGWRIAELAKNLKRAFEDGDQIVEIVMTDKETRESVACYYTPVTASLKKKGQQLGNYLHPMKEHKSSEHEWWKIFRRLLDATYQELKLATTGILLGPPLLSPQKTKKLNYELGYRPNSDDTLTKLGRVGKLTQMSVKYLKTLPQDQH